MPRPYRSLDDADLYIKLADARNAATLCHVRAESARWPMRWLWRLAGRNWNRTAANVQTEMRHRSPLPMAAMSKDWR